VANRIHTRARSTGRDSIRARRQTHTNSLTYALALFQILITQSVTVAGSALNNANPALASLQVSGYRRRIHNLAKLRNKQIRHRRVYNKLHPVRAASQKRDEGVQLLQIPGQITPRPAWRSCNETIKRPVIIFEKLIDRPTAD
jgi:hypothetical protein